MSPQRRGIVPDKLAARLTKAGEAMVAAKAEREAAIMAALRAGGSYREVGRLVGLDQSSVFSIGKANGWPDATELAHRERLQNDPEYRWDQLYKDAEAAKRKSR